MYCRPSVRIVDNNQMKNRPWRVTLWGDLLINADYVNQIEKLYNEALDAYYSQSMSKEETALLSILPPALADSYTRRRRDTPAREVPKLILSFKAWAEELTKIGGAKKW